MSSPDSSGNIPPQPPTLNELIPQRQATESVLRCIGCMMSRSEEGETISGAAIVACSKLEWSPVGYVLRDMKGAGILEPYTPDIPETVNFGNPKPTFRTYLRPTELGATLLPAESQPDCPSQNPLHHLTPEQARVVRCVRCILARTEESEDPLAGVVAVTQVAECLDKKPDIIDKAFRKLIKAELLERRVITRAKWGKAAAPYFYVPSSKGEPWLTPEVSEDCSKIKLESLLFEGLTPLQQKMLGCVACLHSARTPDDPEDLLRPWTVSKCQPIAAPTIHSFFDALKRKEYVRLVPSPDGSQRANYFEPTLDGRKLLRAVRTTEECPSGRIRPIRGARTSANPEEILDLTKRTPLEIIRDLPSQTFKNGTELLHGLNTSYYGNTTHINLVIQALTITARRRLGEHGHKQLADVIQEVVLSIERRDEMIIFPKEMPLLYTILNRRIVDFFRDKNEGIATLDDPDNPAAKGLRAPHTENKIVSGIDARDGVASLIKGMKLNEIERALLEVTAFGSNDPNDESGISEVAERFGKTTNHVRQIKFRLFNRIREDSENQGIFDEE